MTGLAFLPLFTVAAWLLDRLPRQSARDASDRTRRQPMRGPERLAFVKYFAPGVGLVSTELYVKKNNTRQLVRVTKLLSYEVKESPSGTKDHP